MGICGQGYDETAVVSAPASFRRSQKSATYVIPPSVHASEGMMGSFVSSLRAGAMSNTANTFAMVVNSTSSARNRPGQILRRYEERKWHEVSVNGRKQKSSTKM